jgi:hypothetical protein
VVVVAVDFVAVDFVAMVVVADVVVAVGAVCAIIEVVVSYQNSMSGGSIIESF